VDRRGRRSLQRVFVGAVEFVVRNLHFPATNAQFVICNFISKRATFNP